MKSKEVPVEQLRSVPSHSSREGHKKKAALRKFPRAQWPPSIWNGRRLEQPVEPLACERHMTALVKFAKKNLKNALLQRV